MEGRVLDATGVPLKGEAIVRYLALQRAWPHSHFDPSQKEFEYADASAWTGAVRYRFRSFLPPGYAIPPNSPTSELFGGVGAS